MASQSFGEKLKELRERAGMTHRVLARRAGINRVAVYAYEKGSTTPCLANVQRLAHALGVNLNEFGKCDLPEDGRRLRPPKARA